MKHCRATKKGTCVYTDTKGGGKKCKKDLSSRWQCVKSALRRNNKDVPLLRLNKILGCRRGRQKKRRSTTNKPKKKKAKGKKRGSKTTTKHTVAALDKSYTQEDLKRARAARQIGATIGHGLRVGPSTIEGAGCGLFATKRFKKNKLITGMEGRTIDKRQADALRAKGQHQWIRALLLQDLYVNGLRCRKWGVKGVAGASFANDSRNAATNNSTFHSVDKVGKVEWVTPIIALKATRDIKRREEIFVSYGRTYWH